MIYLASPFSHPDPAVMKIRYRKTFRFTAQHLQMGEAIFSPIVYGWPFYEQHYMGPKARDWYQLNVKMIHACEAMWVLMLPGWEESGGVRAEVLLAHDLGKTVLYKELPHASL